MVVGEANVHNIMSGIENTGGVKQHSHKKKLRQRFDIIKKLGQGTFGKVQLGINKETGQEVAIKTIKKSKIESEADLVRIRREIQIMSSVQHPNIIHIYEVFENKEKMVLVMEYAAGGELYDYLSERKVLSEEEARRIFRQIATACYYCHKHKICHRDLKLENILLDENNNAKIADFGLSNVFDDQRLLNTFCGSPLYASPEIVKGTPYHGPEVDCWSLGVLLYTLVYGAMPFDGSNFKRLVKQISQGDYFEPSKPSPASPLIRDMLTVSPRSRADIEKICTHWWVNEGYPENCLEISEDLANQTPVRLDVLLSLAPPPPQLESDKLVVTADVTEDSSKMESLAPTRSQSLGSIMEYSHPAEKRIIDLLNEEKVSPKRKLEMTVSTDRVNSDKGLKRKEKIIKENTVADITVHGAIKENTSLEDASMSEPIPLDKSSTRTISKEMDIEQTEVAMDPSLQGAACSEIIEAAERKESKKQSALKKTLSTSVSNKILEGINEIPSQENVANNLDKENIEEIAQESKPSPKEDKPESKITAKRKSVKKKVLVDKNENFKPMTPSPQPEDNEVSPKLEDKPKETEAKSEEAPTKTIERRRSRIFEAAEKFQNMITPTDTKPVPMEKPKKILIPGVSVDGFKKEFERKASLTSTSPPKLKATPSKKIINGNDKSKANNLEQKEDKPEIKPDAQKTKIPAADTTPIENQTEISEKTDDDRIERVKNAVSIISSALDKEGARKSKSRPCMMRKPPVPFGMGGRSASGNITMLTSPLSPPIGPKPYVKPQFDKAEPKQVKDEPEPVEESKTSSAEITLKSATLPRRKTTKAEIQLNYPVPKPVTMEFKTEMAHNIEAAPKLATQRSEVVVPVAGSPLVSFRSSSLEPEQSSKASPRERIIPIAFEKPAHKDVENVQSPPAKPPMPKTFQTQKSYQSQKSNLSRQSTQDSDTETIASSGEPIKKSAREYIIPIAVEGGGYVTPRAGSLEPSDNTSSASTLTNRSKTKFGRARRMNSLLSDRDSEDESPFSTLHRHSSIGRDSDTEDSRRDALHMHRLRSTRPKRSNLEHTDSLSSGEEDDDDGFEILTAENLFSTLLSRVRDLTQRLNVDDGSRPGFPTSRLLSHFDHGTNFWNRMDSLSRHAPLGRTLSRDRPTLNSATNSFGAPWRRSVTRDLASDIDSVYNDTKTQSPRPRGDKKTENLNLADLDLKKLKLSEEDALALSYLTPGLSKRIQRQLFSQLTPSEARKLHRTLSSRDSTDNSSYNFIRETEKESRRSMDRLSSTLPRRFSVEKNRASRFNLPTDDNRYKERELNGQMNEPAKLKDYKSFLPKKSYVNSDRRIPSYEFNIRSSSIGCEPRGAEFSHYRPRATRSVSVREPRYSTPISESNFRNSPDSSLSESLSRNDESSSYKKDSDSVSDLSSKAFSADSSISRPYSKYSPDSSFDKYSTPSKSYESPRSFIPSCIDSNKAEVKKPSTRKVSRFLRPDFFDTPKEENLFLKEKKEREMETQKVLKEIRDKRKYRLNMRREKSLSSERQFEGDDSKSKEKTESYTLNLESTDREKQIGDQIKETKDLLKDVSNNIKNLEGTVQNIHDYINVPAQSFTIKENKSEEESTNIIHDYVNIKPSENRNDTAKKERVSRIARPKSYPTENGDKNKVVNVPPEKESKLTKLRKGFVRPSSKEKDQTTKEDKNEANKIINEEEKQHKNKLLQSIEKKLEKFRANNNSSSVKESDDLKALNDKKTSVESAIKRLREQSEPRNVEQCTESTLIKRAVSVEDLSNIGMCNKPLQASRKSVTKILGLFKKYEEQENKKGSKKTKTKETDKKVNKSSKVKKESDNKTTESVILSNNVNDNESKVNSLEDKSKRPRVEDLPNDSSQSDDKSVEKKPERPRSLLFDKVKHFQNVYNGARSDSVITNDRESKVKSKLPVNSFRRSLNLENLPEPPKFYKNPSKPHLVEDNQAAVDQAISVNEQKIDRKSLKLDFTKLPNLSTECKDFIEPTVSVENPQENRNSLITTDDSSACLSPDDYLSCDSWSVCSDYHTQDLSSPLSPNGLAYSGDENESVIDRIRRKSFYTRFNEKKRPRRTNTVRGYKDLDLYKDVGYKTPTDYSSLDRRSYDYRAPVARRSSYASSLPEPVKANHKARSSSLLNDYVNVPSRYQTYSSKIGRPAASLYSDSEDNILDDHFSTAKSRTYSPHIQTSRLNKTSVSPVNEQYYLDQPLSSVASKLNSPTSSEPV